MRAPETYARLLLELAPSGETMAQVRALAGDPALREALEDPTYDRRDKTAVVGRLFPVEVRQFFRVRQREGVARVTFTCCHEPTPEQRKRVEDLVCRKYGKTGVEWHTVLDPAILGGFILTVDDWVLDKSLRTMAEDLRRHVIRGNTL